MLLLRVDERLHIEPWALRSHLIQTVRLFAGRVNGFRLKGGIDLDVTYVHLGDGRTELGRAQLSRLPLGEGTT